MSAQMMLTLIGTGTSDGVPIIGCNCKVCKSEDSRNRRFRTSGWLHGKDISILIDCGPDFRAQALTYGINTLDGILITHGHRDHIAGLDDVRPINMYSGRIPIYILDKEAVSLRQSFHYMFEELTQIGGGVPDIYLHELKHIERIRIKGVDIYPLLVFHGTKNILGYRFGDTAFITDASSLPDSTRRAIYKIPKLVINALRYRPHSTHFNVEEAIDLVQDIKAGRAWFVHTTHDLDYTEWQSKLPENILMGADGMKIPVQLDYTRE